VTFSVSVANPATNPVPSGGVVDFYLGYGTPAQKLLGGAPLVAGSAAYSTRPTALPAGDDTIPAVYNGTANFQPGTTNAVVVVVAPAGTTAALASVPSGSVSFGTPVTFTAALTDPDTGLVPSGLVQFWDGTRLLGTVGLDRLGQASLTRSLVRGSHSVTAVYLGTANFTGSTSGTVAISVS
jgi:hypothetical protein